MDALAALAIGYLLGSIPFGLILTRLAGAGDLRAIGSGNIGATNVLRTGNKGLAAATLLLDGLKGFVAVLVAWRYWPDAAGFAALGAIVGHCFPVWLRFRGGKGVATAGGACLGLAWPLGAIYAGAWVSVLAMSRISSLAGLAAAVAAPVAALVLGYTALIPVLAAIAVIVLIQHRANIARLRAGTEPRIGSRDRA
ncbi:glycerol-3-phosphate 1-O-acyltransferase PlsY [Parablastomonas sp. CN1-191]|uniref:glycerol-3-phosphate 1-O-acyltransferase PlsY n=1 Tax=Parablastomonas sp. CN1-191 TaxID=3400908 RepID=UPI003BF8BFE2